MITGELEYLYGKGSNEYEYDYFFKKLFKKKTKAEKQQAKEKRRQFFSKGGKAEEIVEGVNSIIDFVSPKDGDEESSDFEIGLGEEAPINKTKKKGIPKAAYMGVTIAVVIGGLWAYSHFKAKALVSNQ